MKSENSIILNTDRKVIIENIFNNIFREVGNFNVHSNLNFPFPPDKIECFCESEYKIYSFIKIKENYENFLDSIIQATNHEIRFAIFDRFSSYKQMYENFELSNKNFCYNFVFLDLRYNFFQFNENTGFIDEYIYLDNAYTLDISTVTDDYEEPIFKKLVNILGLKPVDDFTLEKKYRISNFI